MNKVEIIFTILLILLITSCRQTRVAPAGNKATHTYDSGELQALVKTKHRDFNTLKIKRIDIQYKINGSQEKFSGSIAIYRDSLIVLSIIPALGFELMRILITPDSVIVLNRLDKTYFTSGIDLMRRKYKIALDFDDIQSVLANEMFYYRSDNSEYYYRDQTKIIEGQHFYLIDTYMEDMPVASQGFYIGESDFRINRVFVNDFPRKLKMNIYYDEFIGTEEFSFPKAMKMNIIEGNNLIDVILNYGQIEFDEVINVEFAVPPQYTRIDM